MEWLEDIDPQFFSTPFDLVDLEHEKRAQQIADLLLATGPHSELPTDAPTLLGVADKLARSKEALRRAAHRSPFISVVFAMYLEHEWILSPNAHPQGEDFLNRKVGQLEWLCKDLPVDWQIVAVDDGCPEGSGRIAQRVVNENKFGELRSCPVFG